MDVLAAVMVEDLRSVRAEQATTTEDRTLAVKALTDCAVLAARWRAALGVTPAVVAFPGGAEQS